MRKLVHVSDLHFGIIDEHVVGGLLASLRAIRPDLVVISGDITQRATQREFAEARRFLEALRRFNLPFFVIPGNHDITPIYRPLGRMMRPFRHYKRYISNETEHFFADDEIAIASINTVKRAHTINGRVGARQAQAARNRLASFPQHVRILVTHHPLVRNANRSTRMTCWRSKRALRTLTPENVDIFLCGHHHHSSVTRAHAVEVHAGTVSERLRGEPPSFNVLAIHAPHLVVTTWHWHEREGAFRPAHRRELSSLKQSKPRVLVR